VPLAPKNSDALELKALRESGLLGRIGKHDKHLFAFEYSLLPAEARRVVQLILDGAPLPYPAHDGNLFQNRAGDLPGTVEYREFTVPTPEAKGRGKRRLVIRRNGMMFFTACHYDRIPGDNSSEAYSERLEAIDPQWRHGFYVVTGIPPAVRAGLASAMERIRNSRLPAVVR
jgi:hypothetical protein